VKRVVLLSVALLFNATTFFAHSKIYDCFLFFNELELLEIRLNELYDHVDKFVLVESSETFRGAPKPLYYQENKHLLKRFTDKIIHVIVDGHYETNSAWDREAFQRNQIMAGLKDCMPDDIILISDVDEIIRPSSLLEMSETLSKIPENNLKLVLFRQTLYRYYFNRFDHKDNPWPGTIALFYKDFANQCPDYLRNIRDKTPFVIYNSGWHFTYMGGHQRVVAKLAAFSHAECDTIANRDLQNLKAKIATFPLVPIDKSYPAIIQNNQEEYTKMGFIDVTKP
jgi:beta-1,4-mannosyl-glycoprotein beta-1,4-N-acetylglucosaminyltransferase